MWIRLQILLFITIFKLKTKPSRTLTCQEDGVSMPHTYTASKQHMSYTGGFNGENMEISEFQYAYIARHRPLDSRLSDSVP